MVPGRLWDASGRPLDGRSCPGSVRPLAGLDALGPRQVATFLFHGTGNQLRVYFGIFSDSWYHASDKNFGVEMKACFCWIKWLTSNIRHNRNNFHLTWESTFPTGAWALTAWAVFPRPVGVTIRGNLIGLPLLRVVNNSDRWMGMARSKSRGTDSFWH